MFFKHLLLVAYFYTDSPPSDWGFYIVDQLNKVWPLSPCFVAAASAHVSLLTCLLSARSRWLKSKRTADQWRTREHALLFFSFFFFTHPKPILDVDIPILCSPVSELTRPCLPSDAWLLRHDVFTTSAPGTHVFLLFSVIINPLGSSPIIHSKQ